MTLSYGNKKSYVQPQKVHEHNQSIQSHLENILVTYFNFAYFFCAVPFGFVQVENTKTNNSSQRYTLKTCYPQKVFNLII